MSQWNNSYAYNNQYQGHNSWNGEMSGQYQAYFPNRQFDTSNQYVSFNEFLAQMQNAGVPAANPVNYNSIQYPNYPNNQYSYQNIPPQSAQIDHSYGASVNNMVSLNNAEPPQAYQMDNGQQNQYDSAAAETNKYNEIVFNSKLTPTATEFVPKSSGVETTSSSSNISPLDQPSTSKILNETVNTSNSSTQSKPSSSETNWRERPQTASQNGSTSEENIERLKRYFKGQNRNGSANGTEKSNHNNDFGNQDHYYRNQDSSRSQNGANGQNNEGNSSRYTTDTNSDNSETSTRHQERNRRNNDSNNQRSHNRYYDTNNHNREQSRSNDNYRGEEGQSRPNSKQNSKNKESDAGRMFYNSSMPKGSQDVRNGRGDGSGRRGWAGSQRVRPAERNIVEDEQYANTYLQHREEKLSKEPKSSPARNKNNKNGTNTTATTVPNTEMTQRERLSEQLDKGTLECLVCCDRVKQMDQVWWCTNCYHVLHLKCIRKWALSSVIEGKWRCPACQNSSSEIPVDYRCMCGTFRNPEYQRGASGAHTCGRACKRRRKCPHPCTLLCHPGPCPPCQATISKECGCGTDCRSVLCSSKLPQVCGRMCKKMLSCKKHMCMVQCHEGRCKKCEEIITQKCYCSTPKTRVVECERGVQSNWTCGAECGRVLECGHHVCRRECHRPPCATCPLRPEKVPTCPCGKTKIKKNQRVLCTDPIPLCDNICAKPLPCGPDKDRHFCKEKCHEGECPACPDSTHLQCRCGHSTREVPCRDLPENRNSVTCQRKCNKKLNCGRHKCREVCCAGSDHLCVQRCGRSLFCQQHRCEDYCHAGHCAPCPRLIFEEVRCECGVSVVYPPVRCGTRPPPCEAPCIRERPCGHDPHHTCHTGDCPPCVVLTARVCYGGHEERKTIPCSQEEFSCGLPCGKPLPCGKHTCIKICHKGPCDTGKCTQPCTEKRPSCGHPCAAPCHAGGGGVCPSTAPCRRTVRATCPCGRRSAERACCDNARDLARIMSQLAVSKMQDGGSVDLSDVQRPVNMLKTLECDEECRQEARSRQLALALQIRNPDVSAKLAPRYSEHVRATAAREPVFANHVHERLTELVQRAKNSKQKTRSHSFPSMNRQKRQFIHEMCEHFGCESVAYDAEPNRNVVATADREKSWLPAMSVLEVLAREAGKRRVPGPVLRAPAAAPAATTSSPAPQASTKSTGGWATLTSTNAWAARSARSASQQQQQQQPQQQQQQQQQPQQQQQQSAAPKIDYFDNPPDN